jgi:hypothetical protein
MAAQPEQQPPHRVAGARLTCGQPTTQATFPQVIPKREDLTHPSQIRPRLRRSPLLAGSQTGSQRVRPPVMTETVAPSRTRRRRDLLRFDQEPVCRGCLAWLWAGREANPAQGHRPHQTGRQGQAGEPSVRVPWPLAATVVVALRGQVVGEEQRVHRSPRSRLARSFELHHRCKAERAGPAKQVRAVVHQAR